jgi:BioD-like phosphotransacetylase family protein
VGIVQVVANEPGAGKTCLIAAMLRRHAQAGRSAGYYKPFSATPDADVDRAFMSQLLSEAGAADTAAAPIPEAFPLPGTGEFSTDGETAQAIRAALTGMEADYGAALVEGPNLTGADGAASPLAANLWAVIKPAAAVLVVRWQPGLNPSAIKSLINGREEGVVGVVFNHCPVYRGRELAETVIAPLRESGIAVWGAIPEDRAMLSVTVQQVADHLRGSWVQEPANVDAPVDHFLIGGNIMDSGPNYFGRYANQGVITRAERPDIQLASLMRNTRCLVLTGGGEPSEYIRVEAAKRDVPLISVAGDTLSTAEALNGILDAAKANTPGKAERFAQLMELHLDLRAMTAAVG